MPFEINYDCGEDVSVSLLLRTSEFAQYYRDLKKRNKIPTGATIGQCPMSLVATKILEEEKRPVKKIKIRKVIGYVTR